MGIKGLTGLISEHAPAAIQVLKFSRSRTRSPRTALTTVHQEHKINTLFGRKVAIDASMSIYQFLIAVRQQDGQLLQNDAGEVTRYAGIVSTRDYGMLSRVDSHLMGFFYRTIRMVENGIKPAYVFDGKPPELKSGVVRITTLSSRLSLANHSGDSSYPNVSNEGKKRKKQEKKQRKLVTYHVRSWDEGADLLTGTAEDLDKFSRRTVKVTREHNEECRKLLALMGIPVVVVRRSFFSDLTIITRVQAPSEAEAQCAELARGGKVCAPKYVICLANRVF